MNSVKYNLYEEAQSIYKEKLVNSKGKAMKLSYGVLKINDHIGNAEA